MAGAALYDGAGQKSGAALGDEVRSGAVLGTDRGASARLGAGARLEADARLGRSTWGRGREGSESIDQREGPAGKVYNRHMTSLLLYAGHACCTHTSFGLPEKNPESGAGLPHTPGCSGTGGGAGGEARAAADAAARARGQGLIRGGREEQGSAQQGGGGASQLLVQGGLLLAGSGTHHQGALLRAAQPGALLQGGREDRGIEGCGLHFVFGEASEVRVVVEPT